MKLWTVTGSNGKSYRGASLGIENRGFSKAIRLFFLYRVSFRVPREDSDPRWESGKVKPDDGQRDLGELFDEAPSRASYPEYYAKVTNVMDLKIIKAKARKEKGIGDGGVVARFCFACRECALQVDYS